MVAYIVHRVYCVVDHEYGEHGTGIVEGASHNVISLWCSVEEEIHLPEYHMYLYPSYVTKTIEIILNFLQIKRHL